MDRECSMHGKREMHTELQLENSKGRDHSEDLGTDGMIIFKWILGKYGGKVWTGCIWLRLGTSTGSCEHENESLGFVKGGEFCDWLSDY
jgi:hypothetical protein